MNSSKLCFQHAPTFNPCEVDDIRMDLIKDLRDFYIQAHGARWEKAFATAVRLMRRHDGGSALRDLYKLSMEVARKETINKIKNATICTFKGILHTIEIYVGPIITVDSGGNYNNIHTIRMWYIQDFMNDLKIK